MMYISILRAITIREKTHSKIPVDKLKRNSKNIEIIKRKWRAKQTKTKGIKKKNNEMVDLNPTISE